MRTLRDSILIFLTFILMTDRATKALSIGRSNTPMSMSTAASSPSGEKQQCVAVIGTTGRLGREAVMKLSSRGIQTKCLLRHTVGGSAPPSTMKDAKSSKEVAAYLSNLPGVTMVKGDVTDVESLKELLKGCTSCLALYGASRRSKFSDLLPWSNPESESDHVKVVNYEGVKNILETARLSKTCKRIVRVTGKGEAPWSIFSILINTLGSMAKAWNYEGEELLRNSNDVDYTIVRPGVMGPECSDGKVRALADNGGDLKVTPVRHSDIADLCVSCLEYPNAARTTLTAMNVDVGDGEETYAPLLAKVQPDSRVFPSSLMDENKKAVRVGVAILFAFFAAGTGAVLSAINLVVSKMF